MDGTTLRIVKGPNVKKLLTLAALAAMTASVALPAGAATVQKTVTVQWNLSVSANLNLYTNYNSGAATPASGTSSVGELMQALSGSSACTAPGAGTIAAGTVDFGTITPDSALTQDTVCAVKQAVDAWVQTNSSNWKLAEALTTNAPAGAVLCGLSDSGNFPITVSGAAATSPASARTAASLTDGNATGTGSCAGAGELAIPTDAGNPFAAGNQANMATSTTAYPTGTNVGEDLELILHPSATTGAVTRTLTVELIAN
jgi:hypothetical protein